jgi:decaprenylphospho-beta-D-erythro-pentofuranosid-2-ulose 2-reductase
VLNAFGQFQRIAIFGGKSDIGLSILDFLPKADDVEVFLVGRNLKEVKESPYKIHLIECDFRNLGEIILVLNKIFFDGDLDLAIVSFAVQKSASDHLLAENLVEVINTNFVSTSLLLTGLIERMEVQMHGNVLYISSFAGIRPRKNNYVYGATKAGADFLAQGLQDSSKSKNVSLTILRPGFVRTKFTNGLSEPPFSTDVTTVAQIAVKALIRNRKIVYAPKFLSLIAIVFRNVPRFIFKFTEKY